MNPSDRNCIQTYPSGQLVDPLNLDPSKVRLRDVAHHLSMQCRFVGGIHSFYSVAEHSVLVKRILGHLGFGSAIQLAGLLHDAAEYVMHDISTPLKERMHVAGPGEHYEAYRVAEERALTAIYTALCPGLPALLARLRPEDSDAVTNADHLAYRIEAAMLREGPNGQSWAIFQDGVPTPALLGMGSLGRHGFSACQVFLSDFDGLIAALKDDGHDVTVQPPPASTASAQSAGPGLNPPGPVGASQKGRKGGKP